MERSPLTDGWPGRPVTVINWPVSLTVNHTVLTGHWEWRIESATHIFFLKKPFVLCELSLPIGISVIEYTMAYQRLQLGSGRPCTALVSEEILKKDTLQR